MAKLEVTHLMQQYLYGTAGVRDLSFSVEDASFAIVGGEESGKTSLLRVLSGKEDAARGEVLYDGQRLSSIILQNRRIVYVRERGGLFRFRTVYDNLAYPLKIRKYSKDEIERRVRFALCSADLEIYSDKHVGALPAEVAARVKLARCFLREADYYFIDCVQKNLPTDARAALIDTVFQKIKVQSGVKIFTTEQFSEAEKLAENGAVLYFGVTEQTGLLHDFHTRPHTPEVFRLTHGDVQIEEGLLDAERGIVTVGAKKIKLAHEYLTCKESCAVLVATAADGITKIYSADEEKLCYLD